LRGLGTAPGGGGRNGREALNVLDPNTLAGNPDLIEAIEKGSTRFVAQAIELFRAEAIDIFAHESDLQADIGEDITAEALCRGWRR
jgi:hypothetical protein